MQKNWICSLLASLSVAFFLSDAAARDSADRPNFLVITLDDLQWQTFGHLDPEYSRFTPFLTAYAGKSATFLHSYVPYSLCTPTRASLMTGLDPHRNGVVAHYRSIFTGVRTLPEALKANGYYNGLIGKVRHTLVERQQSLDFIVGPDRLGLGRSPEKFYRQTLEFLSATGGQPFFLNVNIHDPHTPYPGADRADRWKSYIQYLTDRSGLSSTLGSARLEYQGTPPASSVDYASSEVPVYPFIPAAPEVREEMTLILSAARRADRSVEATIAALIEAGAADNTVVMVFSDNGAALPFAKEDVYANSLRAGLIVHVPWLASSAGHRSNALVSINDIYPTVLEMAGIDYDPSSLNGKSLLGLLKNQADETAFRQYLVGYFFAERPERSITDGEYWYIWNPWADGRTEARGHFRTSSAYAVMKQANDERFRFLTFRTPQELYDLERDPNARFNLAGNPEYRDTLSALQQALVGQMRDNLDPMLDEFSAFLETGARE